MLRYTKLQIRRTKTYYRHKLEGGLKYRIGTVSDKYHWEFKPGIAICLPCSDTDKQTCTFAPETG